MGYFSYLGVEAPCDVTCRDCWGKAEWMCTSCRDDRGDWQNMPLNGSCPCRPPFVPGFNSTCVEPPFQTLNKLLTASGAASVATTLVLSLLRKDSFLALSLASGVQYSRAANISIFGVQEGFDWLQNVGVRGIRLWPTGDGGYHAGRVLGEGYRVNGDVFVIVLVLQGVVWACAGVVFVLRLLSAVEGGFLYYKPLFYLLDKLFYGLVLKLPITMLLFSSTDLGLALPTSLTPPSTPALLLLSYTLLLLLLTIYLSTRTSSSLVLFLAMGLQPAKVNCGNRLLIVILVGVKIGLGVVAAGVGGVVRVAAVGAVAGGLIVGVLWLAPVSRGTKALLVLP